MGELSERYCEVYKARFGEMCLPMQDLGRERVIIRLKMDGKTEDLEIPGTGYRWDCYQPGKGLARLRMVNDDIEEDGISAWLFKQSYS